MVLLLWSEHVMDKFFMRPDKNLSPQARHRLMDVKFSHTCAICSFTSADYLAVDIIEDNGHTYMLKSDIKNKFYQVKLPVASLEVDAPEKFLLGGSELIVLALYDYFDRQSEKAVNLTNDRLVDLRLVIPCAQCGILSGSIVSTATTITKDGKIFFWSDKPFEDGVEIPIVLLWELQGGKYKVAGLFKHKEIPSHDKPSIENTRAINLVSEGLYLKSQQKLKEAITCFDKAIKLNPTYAVAWQNKGQMLYQLGEYNAAIECFAKAISLNSNLIMSWNDIGAAFSEIGQYQEALRNFEKAIELAPNWRRPWLNKGVAYNRLGEFYKALECYDRAIEIDPNYAAAWHNRGTVYSILELYASYDKALECFNKALTLEPNNATFYYDKGYFACTQFGHWKEAIESYDKAININPTYADAWNRKGHALVMLGKDNWDEAMNCYKRAIKIDPNMALAWYNMGSILGMREQYREAINCYKKTAHLDPKHAPAWFYLGNCLSMTGQRNEALACWSECMRLDPEWAQKHGMAAK